MNKKIIKTAIAVLACMTICGTALAAPAPRGGKAPARQQQKAPAQKPAPGRGHEKAPARGREMAHHGAPKPAHRPAPVRHPAPPPPRVVHVEHHEANGWAMLGAAVVGGIVGALVH